MRQFRILIAIATIAVFPPLAPGQVAPEGWRWQLDRPAENVLKQFPEANPPGTWRAQEMVPGMHVTTGPGVSLLAPGGPASGRFMVDADIVLFPNSSDQGYGLLIGAPAQTTPDAVAPRWIALLVTADGKFAVLQRAGGATNALVPWTPHEAILKKTSGTVTNRLRVQVERDSLRFFANSTRLGAIAHGGLEVDGHFGLRVEEGVNLHVTNVDIVQRLLKR